MAPEKIAVRTSYVEPEHRKRSRINAQFVKSKKRTRIKLSRYSYKKIYCENKYFVQRHSASAQMKTAKLHMDIRRMKILFGNSKKRSRMKLQVLLKSEWRPNSASTNGWTSQAGRSVPCIFSPTKNILARVFDRGRRLMIAKIGWKIG